MAIYEDLRQALGGARPGSVLLSAEHYEALLERIERLEKHVQAGRKAVALSACRISGQVLRDGSGLARGDLADLRIDLEFRTTAPNVVLPLGLNNLRLTKALLDGETPVWGPTADGLTLTLAEPKVYQLVLYAQLPVSRSADEARLLIEGLPQAAITTLDLTVPEKVQAAQVLGFGQVPVESLEAERSRLRADALGVLSQIDLRWQGGGLAAKPDDPQVVVYADLQTRLGDTTVDTEALVRLAVRQGSVSAIRFRIPNDVMLLQIEPELRSEPVDWSFEPGSGLVILRPRKPLLAHVAPLQLRWRLQQAYLDKPGAPITVGLFELLGVEKKEQSGTIAVWALGDRRFRFLPTGAFRIDPREVISLTGRTPAIACRYWQQPARIDVHIDSTPAVLPIALVRPLHQLVLTGAAAALSSEFEITPRGRASVQEVEVRWPPGASLDRSGLLSGPVESITDVEGSDGLVRVRLSGRQAGAFRLRMDGAFPLVASEKTQLALPAVSQILVEREGRTVSARLVRERGELRTSCRNADGQLLPGTTGLVAEHGGLPELPMKMAATNTFSLTSPGADGGPLLALSGGSLRHQVKAGAEICITKSAVDVVETFEYRFLGTTPTELWFRAPRNPKVNWDAQLTFRGADGVAISQDAALVARAPLASGSEPWLDHVLVLPQGIQRSCVIRLHGLLTGPSGLTTELNRIPLVAPGPRDRLEGNVRVSVWTSAGIGAEHPAADGKALPAVTWPAAPDVAPHLVLSARDLETPLLLNLQQRENSLGAVLGIDRALLETSVLGGGRSLFRVRLRLSPVRVENLILRFPRPQPALQIESIRLNGNALAPETLKLSPAGADSSRTDVTIPLQPRYLRGPLLLDVELPWVEEPGFAGGSLWTLPFVELPQATAVRRVRWRVELPQGHLPVIYGGLGDLEQPWYWWGWLRAPQPTTDVLNFEQWIEPRPEAFPDLQAGPSFSFSQQGSLAAFPLIQCSRSAWLIICSLGVLALGAAAGSLPRRLRLPAIGLLILIFGLLILGWPAVGEAVFYGLQPGLLVLFLVLSVLWVQQQRWRRQVVMLPGFMRLRAASPSVGSSASRQQRKQSSTLAAEAMAPPPAEATLPKGLSE